MNGTNRATRGPNQPSSSWRRLPPPLQRTAFGILTLVLGGVLFWVHRDARLQLKRLQEDYSLVSGRSFFVGVSLRTAVRAMNVAVLESVLHREGGGWAEFEREAGNARAVLATNRVQLTRLSELELVPRTRVNEQQDLLGKTDLAMERYLEVMRRKFAPNHPGGWSLDFAGAYSAVRDASEELIALCVQLVASDNAVLGDFLSATHRTLAAHDRSLKISSALTIALALVLALVVYRGTIAPLHVRLSESQAIIARQEKLASLGVLAAGVAHEIRNPLTAIKFRLFSLRRSLPPAYLGDEDLGVISDELSRLERIVRDFLQFARPSDPSMVRLPVARLLEEVRDLLSADLASSGVQLVLDSVESTWVRADAQQMKQVLINLVRNGAESIQGRGRVTLGVRREGGGTASDARRSACITVRDTGRGIPPEVERRLFDPFFSTKEGGTGLGLSIASRIVEKHGGTLRYSTVVNRGTTFEIVLPALEDDDAEIADHRG